MAPEQQNYVEKAALKVTTPEMVDILKDPTSFDEAKLRKMYQDKLDKVAPKGQLNDAQFRMYSEAKQQIEKNIQDLKEVLSYSKEKMRMKEYVKRTVDAKTPRNDEEVAGLMLNFLPLKSFQALKYNNILVTIDQEQANKEAEAGKNNIRKVMDGYYDKYLVSGANAELGRLKSAGDGEVRLNDYYSAFIYLEDLSFSIGESFDFTTSPAKYIDMAKKRVEEVDKVLTEAKKKLTKEDRALVDDYEKSRANFKGKKGSFEKLTTSLDKLDLASLKDRAAFRKQEALEYGNPEANLKEGNQLYAEAIKMMSSNPKAARELFMQAEGKYNLYVRMAMAVGRKRTPIDQLVAQQNKKDNPKA